MIYEYHCPEKHLTTLVRKVANRHDPAACDTCGKLVHLIISKTHCPPDGIYSYAPNTGDPQAFDRRWENLKAQKRLSDGNE